MQENIVLNEHDEEVVRSVISEKNLPGVGDRYPCLLLVGDDWGDYPYPMESLQRLASGIPWPESAPPIVMISDPAMTSSALGAPLVERLSEPHEHVRIHVSSSHPVASVLNAWIGEVARVATQPPESAEWLVQDLVISHADIDPAVLRFLGIASPESGEARKLSDEKSEGGVTQSPDNEKPEPEVSIPLSSTLRGIAKDLGGKSISAYDLAAALRARHPEYGSHRLGHATWDVPSEAAKHKWTKWLDSVASLYDAKAIARSHHEVLNGRLMLVGLGLYDSTLRETLENAGVWAPLLLEIEEAVIGNEGHLRTALNSIQLAHGFGNDRPGGEDRLGIQGEVNALCEVIMDPAVTPPLAIGLFGAWGTGKSFFMEKMRERIEALATDSNEKRPKVCQIRFNAWHYADTSLWSSLAVEIFERLSDPEPVDPKKHEEWLQRRGDAKKDAREKLLANLETYREAKAALAQERTRIRSEQDRLRNELGRIEQDRKEVVRKYSAINVVSALASDPDVKGGLDRIDELLGVKPVVGQLREMAHELQTTSGYVAAIWRNIRHKGWTASLLVLAAVALAYTVPALVVGGGAWLKGVSSAVVAFGSAVSAARRYIIPATQKVNEALGMVSTTLATATQIEAKLRTQSSREERELELTLADHNRQMQEAMRSIALLDEKLSTITSQVEALTVGRQLYNFLADRAAGYQKYQGVVGMLHRDFLLLDAQLRAHRSESDDSDFPRYDRVVLYIDDLDRCAPEKVLEVLEAVYLLLALELFVVVVGVDPGWLKRSLSRQYRDLSLEIDPTKDPYIQNMPTEYLEKIFQIPMTLPRMEAKAYASLISSLAPRTVSPSTESKSTRTKAQDRTAAMPSSAAGRTPTRGLLEVQAGSAAHGSDGASIDLTSAEVSFIQQLGELVRTPRAAKRLMNTYRLIRATRHVGSRSRFLGTDGEPGEYYAVLTLLAVAAGFPAIADRVLVAIEEDVDKHQISDWKQLVTAFNPPDGALVPEDLRDPGEDEIAKYTAAQWANMYRGLRTSLPANELSILGPYETWGRTVSRFSFTL